MFGGRTSREAGLVFMVLEIESKYACWSLLVHILGLHSPDLVIRDPESVLFYFEPSPFAQELLFTIWHIRVGVGVRSRLGRCDPHVTTSLLVFPVDNIWHGHVGVLVNMCTVIRIVVVRRLSTPICG
jgi:hypothetical protein